MSDDPVVLGADTAAANELFASLERLEGEQAHALERLLTGAVEVVASFVVADDPGGVHDLLVEGLVTRMGLDGAALWQQDGDGLLHLRRSAGLPDELRGRLAVLGPDSDAAALSRAGAAGADPVTSPSRWAGHNLRLIGLGPSVPRVLGVYSRHVPPPLVEGVLQTVARAASAADDNTVRQRRISAVLTELQKELQPNHDELAYLEGFDVGSVYRSATLGAQIGGDFSDVFVAGDGKLGVVCGDVSGKGIEAANLTAMTIHSLRAFALHGTNPQTVLTMVNQTLCRRTDPERFVTMGYALVDPATGLVRFTLAGHPHPVIVGPRGTRLLSVAADLPVGVDPHADYDLHEAELAPGESLVLYTDGVSESRRAGAGGLTLLGTEGLVRLLEDCGELSAQGVADCIWQGVVDWSGGSTSDDCAIMVVRRSA